MKRILHIIAQRPEKTGSGICLRALIEQGSKSGYAQAVIAGIPAAETEPQFAADIDFYPVRFGTADLPFPVVGMTDIMPYDSTMYRRLTPEMYAAWQQAFRETLLKAVAAFNPDVIIAHHLWLLAALARELFPKLRIVAVCHGTDLRQMGLALQFSDYVRSACQQLDHVAALHEDQKRQIMAVYGIPEEKITVIGVGFNTDVFYKDRDVAKRQLPDKLQLVYAGKLNFAKGVPSLLRAYGRLPASLGKLELIFAGAGTGSQCAAIEGMAAACCRETCLKGIVPQAQLAELFRTSQLFVFPSFFEGLPLVLLEALACGMRVVTTDLPGVRDFFGEVINARGLVEYVQLPRLKSIDEPVESELPDFEARFAAAMERQLERIRQGIAGADAAVDAAIAGKTWAAVFAKVEQLF